MRRREPRAIQGIDDGCGMLGALRFYHEVERRLFRGQIEQESVVNDLENVSARLRDDGCHRCEGAGLIHDFHMKSDDSLQAREFARNDRIEDARIDVSAAQDDADVALGKTLGLSENGSETRCAGAFGNAFVQIEEGDDRVFHISLAYEHDIVDVFARDVDGARRYIFNGNTFANGSTAAYRLGIVDCSVHGREGFGFNADDLDIRAQSFCRSCNAADKTTATDRNNEDIEFGAVFEHFEGDGSLPSDDIVVIIRMNECFLLLVRDILGSGLCFSDGFAGKNDLGAHFLATEEFDRRGAFGHDERDAHAHFTRVKCNCLRVVSR